MEGALGRAGLLAVVATLAACGRPDAATVRQATMLGSEPEKAPAAMQAYGCVSCHTIPGVRGANALVGPPLTGFAERRFVAGRVPNEPDYLVKFIVDPQSIKPGSAMPVTGIGPEDARNVAAYLYTLR